MAENIQKITATLSGNGILCTDVNGHQVKAGEGGPRATDLLLMAVAGCSGATLNALLTRDGFKVESMNLTVEGIRSEGRPRRFEDIKVHYEIRCPGLSEGKLSEYVKLTEEVCPVIKSISARVHLSFSLI